MSIAKPIPAVTTPKQVKTYFPFKGLLRSVEFQGIGACLAENVYIDAGTLRKLLRESLTVDTTEAKIVWKGKYKKADGTYQIVFAYPSGTKYKLKAVNLSDNTIGTPTGGAGDVEFTSSNFCITQIGTTGYITNDSTTNKLHTWDGTQLVAVANCPDNPKFVLRDENKIAINKKFSMDNPTTDFNGGSGVLVNGDYAMSLEPVGGVEAGAGIIVWGTMGAESHKVIPNSASDDVSAKTKLDTFSFTGLGILNNNQCVAGKNFVYFINKEGVQEMNPYNGQTVNLCQTGNIKQRFLGINTTNAVIGYESKYDRIACIVERLGQNDTMVVVDTSQKDRAVSFGPGAFYNSLVGIENELYGSSYQDGKIYKLFDAYTYKEASTVQFRWIMEWDALTNAMVEKNIKQFTIFANLRPGGTFTANVYKNGSHEPIKTQVFTSSMSSGIEEGTNKEVWGKYVLNLGGGRDEGGSGNADKIQKTRKNSKLLTYCIEIIEDSFYDFKVYDILLEWRTKSRLVANLSMSHYLF